MNQRDPLHADPGHLDTCTSIATLVSGYPDALQRDVLTAVLRGTQPAFKTARDHRMIAEALSDVPLPIVATMLMAREVALLNPHIPAEFAH